MVSRSKTTVLTVCLCLIVFKVAAAGVFVQAALERIHHFNDCGVSLAAQPAHDGNESTDDKHHQASSLNLMGHITANLTESAIVFFIPSNQLTKFNLASDALHTQNFPDSAFKPPKAKA